MTKTKLKDRAGRVIFTAAAIVTIICVAAIFVFLIIKSVPALNKIGFFEFLFGDKWMPDRDATYSSPSGKYGIFTMICSSLAATLGAMLVGGTIGYFTAVFIAYYCPEKLKRIFTAVINLLAGIPSVVYGFFGITFLLPMLANIAPNNGSGLLATAIILGIMILPTVVSLSKTSLEAVPKAYYEGAVSLGASKDRAVFSVMSPAAKSGITASLVLGAGRAIGETMAVVMVAGNSVAYPKGLFSSFRVMTANIVLEMGYAGELQEGALIATGATLLIFVLLINVAFSFLSGAAVKKLTAKTAGKNGVKSGRFKQGLSRGLEKFRNALSGVSYKINAPKIGRDAAIVCGSVSAVALITVLGFIFANGLPAIFKNPNLIFGKYEFGSKQITILPSIITTFYAVGLSLIIAVPTGICTAIFLNEYASKKNFLIKMVRASIDVLSGVPSIVFGLFGMITFVKIFTGSSSIIAGVATIGIMLLPTVVRSTEESLKSVPNSLREGSYALGAGKLHTVLKVVLPSSLPGILSAVILTIGRVVSESAPFLYTMGSVITAIPKSITAPGATLAVALYQLSGEGWYLKEAYGAAVVLIVITLLLNLAAELLARKLNKKTGVKI